MLVSLKRYLQYIKFKNSIVLVLDNFWDDDIYLIDLEGC